MWDQTLNKAECPRIDAFELWSWRRLLRVPWTAGDQTNQGCLLSPCLLKFYLEFIMWNARLGESQAGIKIARRNINKLRHADDTTLMTESEEELKNFLKMKKESEKGGLKFNIQNHIIWSYQFSSVQFTRSVVSDSLWMHKLHHDRPPCPSPAPEVYSDSCPLSPWCHPTISSSVISMSSHLQSLPSSESLPMSQIFELGDQRIRVSFSASVLPMHIQD